MAFFLICEAQDGSKTEFDYSSESTKKPISVKEAYEMLQQDILQGKSSFAPEALAAMVFDETLPEEAVLLYNELKRIHKLDEISKASSLMRACNAMDVWSEAGRCCSSFAQAFEQKGPLHAKTFALLTIASLLATIRAIPKKRRKTLMIWPFFGTNSAWG